MRCRSYESRRFVLSKKAATLGLVILYISVSGLPFLCLPNAFTIFMLVRQKVLCPHCVFKSYCLDWWFKQRKSAWGNPVLDNMSSRCVYTHEYIEWYSLTIAVISQQHINCNVTESQVATSATLFQFMLGIQQYVTLQQ